MFVGSWSWLSVIPQSLSLTRSKTVGWWFTNLWIYFMLTSTWIFVLDHLVLKQNTLLWSKRKDWRTLLNIRHMRLVRTRTWTLVKEIRWTFTYRITRSFQAWYFPCFILTRTWRRWNIWLLLWALLTSHAPASRRCFDQFQRSIRMILTSSRSILVNADAAISFIILHWIRWTIFLHICIFWIIDISPRGSHSKTLSFYGYMIFFSSRHRVLWLACSPYGSTFIIATRAGCRSFKRFRSLIKSKFAIWSTSINIICESLYLVFPWFLFLMRCSPQKITFANLLPHFRSWYCAVVKLPAIVVWTWARCVLELLRISFLSYTIGRVGFFSARVSWFIITWTSYCPIFLRINFWLWTLRILRTVCCVYSVFIISRSRISIFSICKALVMGLTPSWLGSPILRWVIIWIWARYMAQTFIIDKLSHSCSFAHWPWLRFRKLRHDFILFSFNL